MRRVSGAHEGLGIFPTRGKLSAVNRHQGNCCALLPEATYCLRTPNGNTHWLRQPRCAEQRADHPSGARCRHHTRSADPGLHPAQLQDPCRGTSLPMDRAARPRAEQRGTAKSGVGPGHRNLSQWALETENCIPTSTGDTA
ncbi:hypothetical protein [Kangiella sp.]|uniref:hypothetical protein n=1 Tax=Kangiella sp. TaxID=1920245 RepID=UPI003A914841